MVWLCAQRPIAEGLREGLYDDHPRHDGATREMSSEKRLRGLKAPPPHHRALVEVCDAVEEQEGGAVRQDLLWGGGGQRRRGAVARGGAAL